MSTAIESPAQKDALADKQEWLTWLWFFLSPLYFVIPFVWRHELFRRN
jgi:hypothetical protein